MNISIRKSTEKDIPVLFNMIKEFATYLGKSEKVKISIDDLTRDKESYHCYLAENEKGEAIGYALYCYTYHTWSGKAIYLDDLYVKEKYRRFSVGTMLACALIDLARQTNCKSLQWQVLDWNKEAIAFYKKLGATVGDDNLNCNYEIR